jgi:hypothetical protein
MRKRGGAAARRGRAPKPRTVGKRHAFTGCGRHAVKVEESVISRMTRELQSRTRRGFAEATMAP